MNDWKIEIPFRDRSAPIHEVADCARETLEGEARAIAREIAFAALSRGNTRVGDLLDELDAAGPDGRRQILDQARERVGLESTVALDRSRELAQLTRWPPPPPPKPETIARVVCAYEGCTAIPETLGVPQTVNVKRWWCTDHRHLAPVGDMDEPRMRVPIDARGFPLEPRHVRAHYAKVYAEEEARGRRLREERAAEGERLAALEAEHRAKHPPESPWRIPGYPSNWGRS